MVIQKPDTKIQIFRIKWSEEYGKSGLSIHKTIDAAAKYLKNAFESSENLHWASQAKHLWPEPGWHNPIVVTPVWLPLNRMVAKAFGNMDSFSVYRQRCETGGNFYRKIESLEVAGPCLTINIDYPREAEEAAHFTVTAAARRFVRPISNLLGLKR